MKLARMNRAHLIAVFVPDLRLYDKFLRRRFNFYISGLDSRNSNSQQEFVVLLAELDRRFPNQFTLGSEPVFKVAAASVFKDLISPPRDLVIDPGDFGGYRFLCTNRDRLSLGHLSCSRVLRLKFRQAALRLSRYFWIPRLVRAP